MEVAGPNNGNNTVDNNNNNDENPFGPIFANGVYNDKAHYESERRRVERDLTIPKIVDDLGHDVCDFIEIETRLGGTQLHLTYHPNPRGDIGCDLEWISKPALSKGNGGRFYKEISNKRVHWYYKVLKGDIFNLTQVTFEEDLVEATYNTDLKSFSKKVAKFIFDHPHEEFGTYGCYLIAFVQLIKATEPNMTNGSLQRIAVAVCSEMKRVIANADDKKLPDFEIYKLVRDIVTKPTIQECSKTVHYKISLIDINAQKATKSLEMLDQEAEKEIEAERLVKQAKMDAIKAAVEKRRNQKAIDSGPISNPKILAIEDTNNNKRKFQDDENDNVNSSSGHDTKRLKTEKTDDLD